MPARRKPLPTAPLSPLQQQLVEQLAGGATAEEAAEAIGAPLDWVQEASRSLPILAAALRQEHVAHQLLGRRLLRLAWRAAALLEGQLEKEPDLALEVFRTVAPRLVAPAPPPAGPEALLRGECQERAAAIVEEQAARGLLPFPSGADARREAQRLFDAQVARLLPVADPPET